MVHKGDKDYGMLWILDGEGQAVKAFGYELISDRQND
jgi:hypothetical protein